MILELTFLLKKDTGTNLCMKLLSFVNITCLWILNIMVLSNRVEYLDDALLIFDFSRVNI